ncbi:MAG: DNA gyrase subunit A [Firmicutes bacterium]|jgi:DNA gyrase subunit A|nr:DNA gyrase subunit A [Bacillota bacterium]
MSENNSEIVHGKIVGADVTEQMRQSYIDYAMSVIVERALPDVRDGLKPVHRRILFGMSELGNTPDKPHKKSARIVGEVMGKFHPHGDSAIYDAMVRMAQDFSYRLMLVDGHGNFGSVDGDPPAAMRYTEARLSEAAMAMLQDLNKDTVDFKPNFDETLKEPVVLPSRFPNLLVNGSSGIAVGMATNIPPHNLGEVIDGLAMLIDNPEITIEELNKVIKGPDFPTSGIIVGRDGIRQMYKRGRGRIRVRARAYIETTSNGRSRIIVTEIPYMVNKAALLERIADLVREKKIDGISDLRDESDRTGMRIVIELKRDAHGQIVLKQLYKHTQMQETFGAIMLALVDNEPRILNLKQMLIHYLDHQKEVVTRRTQFDLRKAEERAHILEGLRIALDHLDEVINLIRSSRTEQIAKEGLMKKFGLSEIQAQAILDMRLRRLTGLERDKIEEEYRELLKTISYLKDLLADERKIYGVIKQELLEIKEKFADERRTEIISGDGEISEEELIADEDIVVTISHQGYIKRLPVTTYSSQRRGGKGITGVKPKEDDFVEHMFITSTLKQVLFFTNLGKVYQLKGYEIPEASRQARGIAIVNLLQISPGERITAVIPIANFEEDSYLFFATRLGFVKKTALFEFANIRRGGLIALTLEEGDELVGVHLTGKGQEVLLATTFGQSIRFRQEDVRSMGRNARGVRGIELRPGDSVVAMDAIRGDADVLVVTENGFGKRTPIAEYRLQSRGGKGIKTININEKNGSIVSMKLVDEDNELMVITAQGIMIRIKVAEISLYGRAAQGVKIMSLAEGDQVVSVAKLVNSKED